MYTRFTIASSMLALCMAPAALAGSTETFTETFDRGNNEGNWTFGIPGIEVIQDEGGNPGWWLHSTCEGLNCLDTFAPQPRTTPMGGESEFTGNYAERGVVSIGVDLQTLHVDFSADGRPLTIILVNDNGTPEDEIDSWGAYFIGPDNVPLENEGWKSYDFDIPSQETELPDGWQYWDPFGSMPEGATWGDLITDVSQVRYFYGNPEFFFIFQQWELGMDNARITVAIDDDGEDLVGDLNGDGVVDVLDLLILLNNWGSCPDCDDCPADLNGDCNVGVADLLILLSNWDNPGQGHGPGHRGPGQGGPGN